MYKLFLSVFLVFSMGLASAADPVKVTKDNYVVPKQTITGAEKAIPIGEAIKLSLSKAEIVAPLSAIDETWNIYEFLPDGSKSKLAEKPVDIFDKDGTKVVVFGSGNTNRTVLIHCSVTYLYITKTAEKIDKIATKTVVLTADLVIGDGTNPIPPPNPKPKPVDPVTPIVPDGSFGLTKLVYNSVNKNMTGQNRVLPTRLVAVGFDSIVAQIKSKKLISPEEILKATADSSIKSLKDLDYDKAGWTKASTEIQDALFELYSAGKLSTAEDYGSALQALSDGLKLIK